jgi:hypothetical protein
MDCRLRNTSGQQPFFLFFFLGTVGRKKTILQAGISKSAAHTVFKILQVL